jgi:nitrite reductase/ring-hydroxylating ferredoxin subunit
MFVKMAKEEDLVNGGLMLIGGNGKEAVLCNYEGKFFAIERRCGHMNAPLEMGTLTGYIMTCPMHSAQFSIITGEALVGPIPAAQPRSSEDLTSEAVPGYFATLMSKIRTNNIRTFPVKVEEGWILVDL